MSIALDSLTISPSDCNSGTTTLTIHYFAWKTPGETNPVNLTFEICNDPEFINLIDGGTRGSSISWDETLPATNTKLTKSFTVEIATAGEPRDCNATLTAADGTYITSDFIYS